MNRVLVRVESGISLRCKPQDIIWIKPFAEGLGYAIGDITLNRQKQYEHHPRLRNIDCKSFPVTLTISFGTTEDIRPVEDFLRIMASSGCMVEGEDDPDIDENQWIIDLDGDATAIPYTNEGMLDTYLPEYVS